MAMFGAAQSRIDRERDDFIETIRNREDDIRRLASSYHDEALLCEFFQPSKHDNYIARGSFNICFFVQFCSGEKWVVRIPLRPCLAFSPQSKLDSEVATMSLIAERTSIPIPRIIAYSCNETADPLSTFIIMEYVGGEKLSAERLKRATETQKNNLYTSLANVYIQLRRLEFPAIGRLARCTKGGFEVSNQALTVDTNSLQLEGLNSFATQSSYHDKKNVLISANEYIAMRLQISWNAFLKSQTSIEHGMGANVLYHQDLFHQHAKKWADPTLDLGPFVLVHGDLGPQNLMVDEGLRITAVIDWEWSRVVPIQFFTPPLWLTCRDTVSLSAPSTYKLYLMKGLSDFLRVIEARELDMFQDALLFREWNTRKEDGGPLVANALENWTDIDWFAYRYLSQGKDDDVDKHVKAFIEADPIRGSIVRMKEDDAVAYEAKLQQLKDDQSRHGSSSESKRIADKLLRYRLGISSMAAAFLSSKHTKLWMGQSTPMLAVASVVVLGVLLIGKRMVAIPNLLAR